MLQKRRLQDAFFRLRCPNDVVLGKKIISRTGTRSAMEDRGVAKNECWWRSSSESFYTTPSTYGAQNRFGLLSSGPNHITCGQGFPGRNRQLIRFFPQGRPICQIRLGSVRALQLQQKCYQGRETGMHGDANHQLPYRGAQLAEVCAHSRRGKGRERRNQRRQNRGDQEFHICCPFFNAMPTISPKLCRRCRVQHSIVFLPILTHPLEMRVALTIDGQIFQTRSMRNSLHFICLERDFAGCSGRHRRPNSTQLQQRFGRNASGRNQCAIPCLQIDMLH